MLYNSHYFEKVYTFWFSLVELDDRLKSTETHLLRVCSIYLLIINLIKSPIEHDMGMCTLLQRIQVFILLETSDKTFIAPSNRRFSLMQWLVFLK